LNDGFFKQRVYKQQKAADRHRTLVDPGNLILNEDMRCAFFFSYCVNEAFGKETLFRGLVFS